MISAGVWLSLAISRKLSYISSIAQGGLSEIIFPTTGGKALVRQSGSLVPRHTNFYASKHCGFYFLNIYHLPFMKHSFSAFSFWSWKQRALKSSKSKYPCNCVFSVRGFKELHVDIWIGVPLTITPECRRLCGSLTFCREQEWFRWKWQLEWIGQNVAPAVFLLALWGGGLQPAPSDSWKSAVKFWEPVVQHSHYWKLNDRSLQLHEWQFFKGGPQQSSLLSDFTSSLSFALKGTWIHGVRIVEILHGGVLLCVPFRLLIQWHHVGRLR